MYQGMEQHRKGFKRCARNVRAITAALFYTFAFQMADIIATRAHCPHTYHEGKVPMEGNELQKKVFEGELQLRVRNVQEGKESGRENTDVSQLKPQKRALINIAYHWLCF